MQPNAAPMEQGAYRPTLRQPRPGATPQLTPDEVDALEHKLKCQCGCILDVYTCRTTDFTCTVSPAMHQEFDLDYLNPLYARFGLVYYGCCEPLHAKLDIVRKIPNVRKVSMSPWVDEEAGAAGLGSRYVFSR